MLIEFSVANFRSFRHRQTLSMVAAPKLKRRQSVFAPSLASDKVPNLLKACVIYGPNASGKSNLLKALLIADYFARRTPGASELPLPVAPFKFDSELKDKPSEFEYHFISKGQRYQFNLNATAERVTFERLISYSNGASTLLYERRHTLEGDAYEFGDAVLQEAGKDLVITWQKLTPPRFLFLSQAVANSSEKLKVLRAPLDWIRSAIFEIVGGMEPLTNISRSMAKRNEGFAADISTFLREVDVPVARLRFESDASTTKNADFLSEEDGEREYSTALRNPPATVLTHTSTLGEADIAFEDESEGTKNLFGFWLPWTTRAIHAQYSRCILVVDEMDASLHPKIVAALVKQHLSASNPSQLIFTTHDTHLMDSKLLRRDQIWITERDATGATQLRSIHDFEGREGEDIEKRYYEGRYRGLPQLN